ncbi:MAG TPA: glycosyltransferase [Vicinamibacteria bacterium]
MNGRGSRLRVAHVVESLGAGGAETLLADVVERLAPDRFESRVLALDAPLHLLPRLRAAGVWAEPIALCPRRRPLACAARLARRLRAYRPHVIHTHLYFANVLGRLAASATPSARVVTTLHNPDYTHESRPGPRFAARKALDRWTARRNAAFVAVSSAVAEDYRRQMGWTGIEVIHNGVDLDHFAPAPPSAPASDAWPQGALRVLSVGRLHGQKGHTLLLQAAAACRSRGLALALAIAGEGPLHAELEAQARAAGLGTSLRLLGRRSDVRELMRACDVFVFPSLYEAFGVALLEAMACGAAVVASRVGGIPEIVEDGASGLLVPPADPAALADAIACLAERPDRRRALGRAARLRAEAFDIRETVRRLESLYARLGSRR